jgi:Fe2+ transport system protein FeoA
MSLPLEMLPLHLLPAGCSARVAELVGDIAQVHRMEEIGLRRGAIVKMLQPGTPCVVHVDGSRLCFRESEAIGVLVSQEESP